MTIVPVEILINMNKIYNWNNCPNVKLTDACIVWWNELAVCIDISKFKEV